MTIKTKTKKWMKVSLLVVLLWVSQAGMANAYVGEYAKMVELKDEAVPLAAAGKEVEENEKATLPVIKTSVQNQLKKIQTPFGKHLYNPLTFQLQDGTEVFGSIYSISEREVTLVLEENQESQEILLHQIEDIIWRGAPLKEQ